METVSVFAWVGSVWYEDCDPFLSVAAKDADTCERLLQEAMADEDDRNDEDEDCEMCTTGAIYDTCEMSPDEADELETQGYVYLSR